MTGARLSSRPSGSPRTAPAAAGLHRLTAGGREAPLLLVPAPGSAPPGAVDPRPLLVFLHGAGGRGHGALGMVEDVARRRGLLVLLPTSVASTWDLVRGEPGADVAALDAALTEVFAAHPVDRVAVAGFSDGGSCALSLGLANGDLVDAVLAFSPGFAAPPAQVGAPRVFISHGTDDAVLPIDRCGRRLARVLGSAGYRVRYEEFDGAHVVPPHLVDAAVDWWLDG